jgi:hypothetical protein
VRYAAWPAQAAEPPVLVVALAELLDESLLPDEPDADEDADEPESDFPESDLDSEDAGTDEDEPLRESVR